MPDQGKTLGAAVSSVPLVFFDLIARIVPGTVVLGSILFVARPAGFPKILWVILDNMSMAGTGGGLFVTTIVFVFAYALAVLLWCPGYWVASRFPALGGRWDTHRFRRRYEKLRRTDPGAGERITKLKAQVHMCEVLLFGFILSVGLGIRLVASDPYRLANWLVMACAAACLLASGIARRYCVYHMIDSLNANTELIHAEEEKSQRSPILVP